MIEVVDGPLGGRMVPETMDQRWPAILFWQLGEDCLLGYYELAEDGRYHYTGDTELVPIDRQVAENARPS